MFRNSVGLIALAFWPACACIVLLVALSWLPGSAMVRTGMGGHIEHFMAYFGTAIVAGLAYRERTRAFVLTGLLVALAGILEVGQIYMPGRISAFPDFAASGTGAISGGLLVWALRSGLLGYAGLDRLTVGRG